MSARPSPRAKASAGSGLDAWAQREGVTFAPDLQAMIADGFGPRPEGEDAFDALAGLLGMIEVVDGRRAEAPAGLRGVVVGGLDPGAGS